LLGGFSLECDGVPVQIPSPRLQVLLSFLALHRSEPQRRQALAFLLWPDSSESQAQTNLRTLLSRLHTVLANADAVLQIDPRSVGWHPAMTLEVDAASFEEALQRADAAAKSTDAAVSTALEQAVSAYSGDLLPDFSDEWIVAERERLRLSFVRALEQLIALLERRREYAAGIAHARRLVRLDRLNEAGYLTLMRLYAVTGSLASALNVYHACASTLQSELGVSPGRALTTAYERLLASDAPPHPELRTRRSSSPAPLVGRDREWQRLLATWQIAASGQPRLLILSGEAGIGKTRLATELRGWAGRQGILTAVTECYAAEGDLAYAPVTSWLRTDALRPNLERLDSEWLGEVARLAPELVPKRFSLRPPGPLTERWQRQRLFEALARAILPHGRPILLVIDDLQWCARDTLDWLHFLLRFDARARLLVVGTVRPEEVDAEHPLTDLLNALRHEGRLAEMPLGPLTVEESTALAGSLAGHSLEPSQATRLYADTEGNPLFIVETVQSRLASTRAEVERSIDETSPDDGGAGGGDLPPGVRAVIARRLDQVTPLARDLLSTAAVIGRLFTFALLERVGRVEEDALLAALDELWRRRIVREHGSEAYDFTHDKLRAVAYAELGSARRRTLHRRVAEALEAEHGADLDAICGQLALHYERAGQPTRAIAYLRRAAEVARRLYANATAVANYRRALALGSARTPREAAGLHDELGEVLHLLGRYDEAQAEWQIALQLTPADDHITSAHLHRKLGNVRRDQYRYDDALAAYDAAEAILGSGGEATSDLWWLGWAQIKLERISTLYWLGHVSDMLALVDEVRSVFERRGPASLRARLYQATGAALLRRDRYVIAPETVEMVRAYLRAVEEADDVGALPAARFLHGFVLLWADALAEADREISAALALAERTGDISLEGRCLTYLTVIARKRGQVEQARSLAERSLRVGTAGQMPDYVGAAHGNLAWAGWRCGDRSTAHLHGQEALQAWRQLPAGYVFEWIGRWPLIGHALDRENIAEAVEHARVLLDPRQQRPPAPIELALAAAIHAVGSGDVEAARTHLSVAADSARLAGYL
jgi:DNA-binding SARP family transcriptional activator